MDVFLSFIIPGSFIVFLCVIVGLLIYGADRTLNVLDGHLERLHDEFDDVRQAQDKNHELLLGILRKLIRLQDGNK